MTFPTVRLNAALLAGPSGGPWLTLDDPTRGLLDTGKLADGALGGFMIDLLTAEGVKQIDTKTGRERLLQTTQAGTLSAVVSNPTRRMDPTNLSGPYVSAGRTLLRPMRPIQLVADWGCDRVTLGGTTSDYLSAPHTTAMAVSDLYLEVVCSAPWRTTGTYTIAGKWGAAGQRSWRLQLVNTVLRFQWTTDGTTIQTWTSATPSGFANGETAWIQFWFDTSVTTDLANQLAISTGDYAMLLRVSKDGYGISREEEGNAPGGTGATSIFNASSTPLTLGLTNGADPNPGVYRRAVLYSGTFPWRTAGGPYVGTDSILELDATGSHRTRQAAVFDASWLAAGSSTSVVSYSTDETWTLNGSAVPSGQTTGYKLWSGYADDWQTQWLYPSDGYCTVSATEGFKVLARVDNNAGTPVGTGEKTGVRIGRLLTSAGIATTDRDLDTGQTSCQATTLSSNVATEMDLTSDTERGELHYSGDFKFVFRDRTSRYTRIRSKQRQWLFGDASDGLEIPYSIVSMASDDDLVVNDISIARSGGTAQTAADAQSIADYLTSTFTRTDLIHQTDTESLNYASITLAEYKDMDLRFASISIVSSADDRLWPVILGAQIGDRCTVRARPPGSGTFEQDCFIEGIEHHPVPPMTWTMVLQLSAASRWGGFVLDDPVLGVLDTSRLAL